MATHEKDFISESGYVRKARKALCRNIGKGTKDAHWVIDNDNRPEVITGYDPTYILQFGYAPELRPQAKMLDDDKYLDLPYNNKQ